MSGGAEMDKIGVIVERHIRDAIRCRDENEYFEHVRSIQQAPKNQKLVDAVQPLLNDDSPVARRLAAHVMIAFTETPNDLREQAFSSLLQMLQFEKEPKVLYAIIDALRHYEDVRSCETVSSFATHHSPIVREAVATGLGHCNHDHSTLNVLLGLMSDVDRDVRNWATFAVATEMDNFDSEDIRIALKERMTDCDVEVIGEALLGLIRRGDEESLSLIMKQLASSNIGILYLEAAEELGHPDLLEPLETLKARWANLQNEDDELMMAALDRAILSCQK